MIAVIGFSYAAVVRFAALGIVVSAVAATSCLARADNGWPVKHELIGKDGKKSRDVSGIACTAEHGFPRYCLVIDDNLQEAQFVTLKQGKLVAGEPAKLIDNTFKRKPLELDGEGVAFGGGWYYVIGSHGHPRDKKHKLDPIRDAEEIRARIRASSQVVRFRPDEKHSIAVDIERTPRLREIIASDQVLTPYLDKRLEDNGLTIEGGAVKEGRLYAGFRGPILEDTRAAIVSVEIDTLFGGRGTAHQLFQLPLDGRGVRDLTTHGDLILILAGPAKDGAGTYAVYSWDGRTENVKLLAELSFQSSRKPEALLPLTKRGLELRVLILFDGDKDGAPTPVNVTAP
ncbi:DUF3616 domain-containing protein [Bradyrhizobium sp. NBAIM01]|uniref:DUF3616 domain-containing protein n=1 Tax=Bradyrhizobium sp. NBAIM01 TaxID=2793818 RepID=UPI001CD4B9D3|nr:DUF3616 domain-containing protein [Bradyrhizobium sp. NBAIM01]MCA1510186.1 DUF3616 domain-containing protein [Bradyrhizobium sp. NBAIM01]